MKNLTGYQRQNLEWKKECNPPVGGQGMVSELQRIPIDIYYIGAYYINNNELWKNSMESLATTKAVYSQLS